MSLNGNYYNLHSTLNASSMDSQSSAASDDELPFLWQPSSPMTAPTDEFKSSETCFDDLSEYDDPSANFPPSYLAFIGVPIPPQSTSTRAGISSFAGSDERQRMKLLDFLGVGDLGPSLDDLLPNYDFAPKSPTIREAKCSGHPPGTPTRHGKENIEAPQTPDAIDSHSGEGKPGSPGCNLQVERPSTPSPAHRCSAMLQTSLESSSPSRSPNRSARLSALISEQLELLGDVPEYCPKDSESSHASSSSSSAAIELAPSAPGLAIPDSSTDTNVTPAVIDSEPTLRRSSRKRTATPTYADAAPLPAKKQKIVKGAASKRQRKTSKGTKVQAMNHGRSHKAAVAGPSRRASTAVAAPAIPDEPEAEIALVEVEDAAEAHTQRPRRTCEEVKEDMVLNLRNHACPLVGCQFEWNPYQHKDNRTHLAKHFSSAQLQSDAELACFFPGCPNTPAGKKLLGHVEADHLTLPYLCPVRCGWRSSRSGYQGQHMRKNHHVMNWKC
ncbi:hypothetical protein VTO73DRAFT_11249 [Trametes versicolor]